MRQKILRFLSDLSWYAGGCTVYAVGVTAFITPNHITPGGITGLATLLQYQIGLPTGAGLLLLNLPILAVGFYRFGSSFIARTAIATGLLSAALTVTELWLRPPQVNAMLAAVFGGVLMGIGLSLVLLHGATTGGVDIIAKLLHRRWPHLTVGRLILGVDALVIALTALVYHRLESALYSILALYVSSRLTDAVLYGADKGKMVLIVTRRATAICQAVHTQLRRTVTCLPAVGSYTGVPYALLICTVRRYEVANLCRLITAADSRAFMTVVEVGEVFGEGFKPAPTDFEKRKGRKKWKR